MTQTAESWLTPENLSKEPTVNLFKLYAEFKKLPEDINFLKAVNAELIRRGIMI